MCSCPHKKLKKLGYPAYYIIHNKNCMKFIRNYHEETKTKFQKAIEKEQNKLYNSIISADHIELQEHLNKYTITILELFTKEMETEKTNLSEALKVSGFIKVLNSYIEDRSKEVISEIK